MAKRIEVSYTLRLAYEPGARDPSRLFSAMARAIEAFRQVDLLLARSVGRELSYEQTLESFEVGSFITRIKEAFEYSQAQELEEASDSGAVSFVKHGRSRIVKTLTENPKIESTEPVEKLAEELDGIARETNVSNSLSYRPLREVDLVEGLDELSQPVRGLTGRESLIFSGDEDEPQEMPRDAFVARREIESSIIRRTIITERETILKIKRPDYLGNAKWEFKHGRALVPAKILDARWLDDFHERRAQTGPGDSLSVKVQVTEEYDKNGNLVRETTEILEVREIIPGSIDDEDSGA